jgi:hypothetical protein
MRHMQSRLLLGAIGLVCCSVNAASVDLNSNERCVFDRAAMLALDEQRFDQDVTNGGGGWRSIAANQECELVAADLIAEYRKVHGTKSPLLFWHEGQLRAFSGQYAQAIALFKKSYKPEGQDFGWNAYADATIAFLQGDRQKLDQSVSRLEATPAPPGESVEDGHIEFSQPDGTKFKMPWPVNLDVVQGLQRCMDKPYRDAYSSACRAGN